MDLEADLGFVPGIGIGHYVDMGEVMSSRVTPLRMLSVSVFVSALSRVT